MMTLLLSTLMALSAHEVQNQGPDASIAEVTVLTRHASGPTPREARRRARALLVLDCVQLNGILLDKPIIVHSSGLTITMQQRCSN